MPVPETPEEETNPRLHPEYWEGYRAYPGKLDLMTRFHRAGWEAAREAAELRLQVKLNDIQDSINGVR